MTDIPPLDSYDPGIRPSGFNLLIGLPPKAHTVGSIIIPDNISDRERLSQIEGRLVAMSPACFDFAHFPEGSKPKIGDRVMFAKYGGVVVQRPDGNEYRLITDKDLTAVVEEVQ